MKALVTTTNYLLYVDFEKNSINLIESDRGGYYGISWWPEQNDLVIAHSKLDSNKEFYNLTDYAHSEVGYLSLGNKVSESFLSAPHQILCAPNQIVIAANTGRNCITLYNAINGFSKDIRINELRWDRYNKNDMDGEHFNSVFLKNNYLYIVAHGFLKGSYILQYTYPELKLINKFDCNKRYQMHNIWIDDNNNMFSCDSPTGSLIEVKSNEIIWAGPPTCFLKGLAVSKDFIFVGESEFSSRENRPYATGGIWLIDRKTFKTTDYYSLGKLGCVNEIRLLDEPDEAHHNAPYQGIDILLQSLKQSDYKDDDLKILRAQRLKHDEINHPELQKFKFQLSSFMIDKEGWIYSDPDHLAIMTLKNRPKDNFNLFVEYKFKQNKKHQQFGVILGHKGPQDNNMILFVITYDNNLSQFHILKNKNNNWESNQWLYQTDTTGSISMIRNGRTISVSCNQSDPIYFDFEFDELDGDIGVRTLSGQFKNFSML